MTTILHKVFQCRNENGPFIIADLGLTNGGSLNTSYALIEAAAGLGVNAVKFQMIDADELLGDRTAEYSYPTIKLGTKTQNMYEMFKRLEYTDPEWLLIKEKCDEQKVGLIVTSHVLSAVDRIERLRLPVNKICTWSLTHYEMIGKLAANNKPLILDTGTITLHELRQLESFYINNGGGRLIVLYDFHTNNPKEFNFNAIRSLVELGYEVGYTPQGRQNWLDYMALGLGASVLEKRLTLSRVTPENGHFKALEPQEFFEWMQNVQHCVVSLGGVDLQPTEQDLLDSKKYYKSAWLVKDVKKGEVITPENFVFKRPGLGISSKDITKSYNGKKFQKDYWIGDFFEG